MFFISLILLIMMMIMMMSKKKMKVMIMMILMMMSRVMEINLMSMMKKMINMIKLRIKQMMKKNYLFFLQTKNPLKIFQSGYTVIVMIKEIMVKLVELEVIYTPIGYSKIKLKLPIESWEKM